MRDSPCRCDDDCGPGPDSPPRGACEMPDRQHTPTDEATYLKSE
jgi:hypothetical protein